MHQSLIKQYNIKMLRLLKSTQPQLYFNPYRLTTLLSFPSSKKFHQTILQIPQKQLFSSIQQQNIITRYLNNKTDSKIQQFGGSTQVKKVQYNKLIQQNPQGSVMEFQYKGRVVCLVGMNYRRFKQQQLYKILAKYKPDCVLLNNRPQNLVNNFQLIKKDPQTDIFSDKLYIEQLKINYQQLLSQSQLLQLQKTLLLRKSLNPQPLFSLLNKQQIPCLALSTCLYYQSTHPQLQILPISLPQSVYRQWICNKNSLMQLQQMMKITCKSLALYNGMGLFPVQLAGYLFPHLFININDKYMATIIQAMIALGSKRIILFTGVASNQAIKIILQNHHLHDSNGDIIPLINYLIADQVKSSILRDFQPLQIIQKHILFDVLYHGSNIKQLKFSDFKTTNKIIQKYGTNQPKQLIFKFRYQMILKYSQLLEKYMKQGQKRKQKQFMRSAIKGQ